MIESIASAYWQPLRDFLCAQGRSREDAEDLVQDFLSQAIRTRFFEKADPKRGRFRNFLLASLRHFAENDRRRNNAAKRRPSGGFAQWDEAVSPYYHTAALVDTETPEACFHRLWVSTVLGEVLQRLREECLAKKREAWFAIFEAWLVKPELEGTASVPLFELARKHGVTPKVAANAVGTMKRAFRRLLRAEIATFALTETDAGYESRDVLSLLSMAPTVEKYYFSGHADSITDSVSKG
jgi:RNA polymerase sigma-70 factor (ECF subfamily)